MSSVMTYETLATDIVSYCERQSEVELTAQVPRLIMYAENDIATKLKTLGVLGVLEANLVAGAPSVEKPSFWRNTSSFTLQKADGSTKSLFLRSYDFCRTYAPAVTTLAEPVYYADYNNKNFFISPTPDLAYSFELMYYPRVTPLSDDAQVNWLTENAPQVYLAACMVQAHLFLKNPDRAQEWSARLDDAYSSLTREDNARQADRVTVVK